MKRTSIGIGILLVVLMTGFTLAPRADYDQARGIITLPEPQSPFIALNIRGKVGSQNDPAGQEGLAALTAAMISDGSTTQDSYETILAKLYPMAAGYGYKVDKEMTVHTGRVQIEGSAPYGLRFVMPLGSWRSGDRRA